MPAPLGFLALSEVVERHRFFERWFNGDADEGEFEAGLQRFDPLFRRVDPAGVETDRAALEVSLAVRRGSRRADPVSIVVEEPRLLWQGQDAALAAYVEAQWSPSAPVPVRRRSTALFVASADRGALLWRHVQETSIPSLMQPGGEQTPATIPGDGL